MTKQESELVGKEHPTDEAGRSDAKGRDSAVLRSRPFALLLSWPTAIGLIVLGLITRGDGPTLWYHAWRDPSVEAVFLDGGAVLVALGIAMAVILAVRPFWRHERTPVVVPGLLFAASLVLLVVAYNLGWNVPGSECNNRPQVVHVATYFGFGALFAAAVATVWSFVTVLRSRGSAAASAVVLTIAAGAVAVGSFLLVAVINIAGCLE